MLRLRAQVGLEDGAAPGPAPARAPGHPNLLDLDTLNDLDRRLLRDAMRVARSLQQRVELDGVRV